MMKREPKSVSHANTNELANQRVRKTVYGFLFAFALITLITACGTANKDKGAEHTHGSETWQTTSSHEVMPDFLDNHTALTKNLYSAVHDHADIMSQVNCYCGCMDGTAVETPHKSLLQCYWAEMPGDDGSVTWTDHSTSCGICKKELEEVIALSKQGMTAEEIIAGVDAKFKPKKSNS